MGRQKAKEYTRGVYNLDSMIDALKRYIENTGGEIYVPKKRLEEIARVMTITRRTLFNLQKGGIIDLDSALACSITGNSRGVWYYDARRLLNMLETYKRLKTPIFPPKIGGN